MQLHPNTILDNRYQLIKLLGRGGFSEVWLAKDTWTHLEIAIKVYAPGQGMDQDGLKDFCGELASVYDLNHSNLLKPQHVDTWENMPYLIMAYCPAGSCLKRVGNMTETDLWKLIHDVASGLAYLHDKDVIHQDIKPDNILVDTEGNFLITDFGISTRARSTLRKSVIGGNTSGGTTAYMGPERFSRQPAPTKASDIWSFGAMAFELLEGVTPFGEIGGGMQKSGAEIPFINAQVSDALKFTIFKMLSKDTWDRPTASTLVEWANNPSAIQIDYSLLNPEETAQALSSQVQQTPITNTTNETIQTEGRATQRFGSVEQKESGNETISYSSVSEENKPTLVLEDENTDNLPSKKNNIFRNVLIALFVGGVFIFLMIFIFGLNSFGLGNPPESTKISTIKNNTETTTNIKYYYEQNYSENYHDGICDSILITAKKHYAKGDYLKAKECYQSVVNKCGPNYGAAAMWVKTCDEKELEAEEISVESIFSDNEYKDTLQEQEVNNVELFSKPDKLIFESYGGNKILTIESSSEYSITSTPRWISIEKINNNNKSVFVVAEKNSSSTDRIGFIHIKNEDGKTITVTIKQKCEIIQKKLAIDLGLSVKWATCNVGAKKPEDYGDYFAWGEIQEKETYNWKTYRYCNGTYINLKKYNTQNNYGIVDNKIKLEDKDDSAIANLGIIWRMPTKEEQDELRKCEWILTTRNGIKGYKIVGPNKNFIFLPAAGYMVEGKLYGEGNGYYWANSLYIDYPYRAYGISFSSTFISWNLFERCNGLPIRPVCK